MNPIYCTNKSIFILTEYYNNRTEPYFEHMSDDAVWHGPAIGQYIKGLDNIRAAWKNETNHLLFSLGDVKAEYIQTTSSSCEVMLMFVVTTYYPNGDNIPIFQRIHFSWADTIVHDETKGKIRIPKIFMTHISNPVEQHSDDFIYPEHYNEICKQSESSKQEPRISFRSADNTFYVATISSIIWIETTPDQYCLIHMNGKTLKTRLTMKEIEKQTEGSLVRVHSGYIVNPKNVISVWRFKLSLSDGTIIPIPEKKYTAVKKKLLGMSDISRNFTLLP